MKTLYLQCPNAKDYQAITIESQSDGSVKVSADDMAYTLEFTATGPNSGWVRNAKSAAVQPVWYAIEDETITLWIAGQVYQFNRQAAQAKRRTGAASGPGTAGFDGIVKAPMPGTILKILVSANDTVTANQPLLLMESMKMEMTLNTPITATVNRISCEPGQLVDMNAPLIALTPLEETTG